MVRPNNINDADQDELLRDYAEEKVRANKALTAAQLADEPALRGADW